MSNRKTRDEQNGPALMQERALENDLLHALDYQDLAITPKGIKLIKQAAVAVIDNYMPAVDSSRITVREAMALFVDRVFWDERTGGLFMCTDLANRSVCLPLPKHHWTVRESVSPVQ